MLDRFNGSSVVSSEDLLAVGRQVLSLECEALNLMTDRLGEAFLRALGLLRECRGKVIISGLGKSGIAGKKIAATLSSTGVPSLFLHAGEAGHGDLGVVAAGDVVIALSYSGETRELIEIIPRFKLLGVPVIALTGHPDSALGQTADVTLDVGVPHHPWPYGLLPTASNTVAVGVGDALAVALLVARGVREEDFASLHPGGLLGHKMLVKVSDHMHRGSALPLVRPNEPMAEVIIEMSAKRLGVACVVDDDGRLMGVITDGDLRRLLEREANALELTAEQVMTPKPKTTTPEMLSAAALRLMESHSITSLPVVDRSDKVIGIIHLHDIIKLETQP